MFFRNIPIQVTIYNSAVFFWGVLSHAFQREWDRLRSTVLWSAQSRRIFEQAKGNLDHPALREVGNRGSELVCFSFVLNCVTLIKDYFCSCSSYFWCWRTGFFLRTENSLVESENEYHSVGHYTFKGCDFLMLSSFKHSRFYMYYIETLNLRIWMEFRLLPPVLLLPVATKIVKTIV